MTLNQCGTTAGCPEDSPAARPESVADRNLRVFRAEVLPPLLAALRGPGRSVELEAVAAFAARVDCTVVVRRAADRLVRVRFVADADARRTRVLFDPGLEPPVDTLAAAAFDRLPRDDRTVAAGAAFRVALTAALAPHTGAWYAGGDPARAWRLEWHPDGPRFRPAGGPGWVRVDSDGPARGGYLFDDEPARFTPDGGRLVFTRAGDWWSRAAGP